MSGNEEECAEDVMAEALAASLRSDERSWITQRNWDAAGGIAVRMHIRAILAELKANGYAVVELPTHVADDNNNRAWEWVSRWYRLPDSGERVITTHSAPRTMTVDMAHSFASQLLAAAAAAERDSEER